MGNKGKFKGFFSKFGKVVEHEIIRDHVSKRSRGFGFIIFDNEQVVDSLLADGNMIDMAGAQVEVKKAEPKKPSNPTPAPAFGSDSRGRAYADSYNGFGSSYSNYGSSSFGPSSYRSLGSGLGGRFGDYGYGAGSEFGGRYGDYSRSEFGYRGDDPLSYSGRFGPYGAGLGGGEFGSGLGAAYGRGGGGYGSYGVGSGPGFESGPGYESGPGAGYGAGAGGGPMYGGRAGYSSTSRYHPYAR